MTNSLANTLNEIAKICIEKSILITTAESCTGGGIAYALTTRPGSSAWFDRGFITYSNASKIEMLAVEQTALEKYGAVSQRVAEQMAEGALRNSKASVGISITGIAGPGGGTPEKPLGLIWVSCSSPLFGTCSEKVILSGHRGEIREQATLFALQYLSAQLYSSSLLRKK